MTLSVLLCLLLSACEPLPPIPVPVEEPAPELAPEPEPEPEPEAPVVERNRAPVITSIKVEPATPRTLDDIEVTVEAEDPDDDYVRTRCTWLVNGQEVRGQRGEVLPHTYFEKGDELRVEVLAKDSEFETEGLTPIILVRNTPPEITSKAGSMRKIDGYRVTAQDVDDDELSWRLQGEPEGMSIDERSGTLSYKGSEEAKAGTYQVQVIVEDPDGGSARWAFGITVQAGSAAEQGEKEEG